ncbi:MAG: sulfotransferase [Chloroflexi bacterium]|nr:sulfotransferase [Chloroflexota bacterium]
MLCDLLSSMGIAGRAEEYFPECSPDRDPYVSTAAALQDPDRWVVDWNERPFLECLDRIFQCGTTPNGVFASKLKWRSIPYFVEALQRLPGYRGLPLAEQMDRVFPNLRYVWLTRRDKVRQAISFVKARQSGVWISLARERSTPDGVEFNFHVIDSAVRRIVEEEARWERFFAEGGIVPFTVVYEDLVRDSESTMRGLLHYLGIHLPEDYVFPTPRLQKQADDVSEQWVERYYQGIEVRRRWINAATLPALLYSRSLRTAYILPDVRRRLGRLSEGLNRLARGRDNSPYWHR